MPTPQNISVKTPVGESRAEESSDSENPSICLALMKGNGHAFVGATGSETSDLFWQEKPTISMSW